MKHVLNFALTLLNGAQFNLAQAAELEGDGQRIPANGSMLPEAGMFWGTLILLTLLFGGGLIMIAFAATATIGLIIFLSTEAPVLPFKS